jgi:type II secretory pathway pseudopilin PulG
VWKLMEVKREQLEREQQHQREQQHRLEQHQQQQLLQFQKDRQTLGPNNPDANAPGLQLPKQQAKQGKANFSIIGYLTHNQNTSYASPGYAAKETTIEGPTAVEAGIVSPVHGINPEDLAKGLPPMTTHRDSGSDSDSDSGDVSWVLAKANTSTGSATVDHLEVRLSEEDMDEAEAPDKSTRARMEDDS